MKKILIIGSPASGKTELGKRLAWKFKMPIIHTDNYIGYGQPNNLYVLLEDLKKRESESLIIEGVLNYRLLRKGIEGTGYNFVPDLVIEVEAPESWIEGVYANDRSDKDYNAVLRMRKANQTVLSKYEELLRKQGLKRPTWIKVQNEGLKFKNAVEFLNI